METDLAEDRARQANLEAACIRAHIGGCLSRVCALLWSWMFRHLPVGVNSSKLYGSSLVMISKQIMP